ncbi:MAG: hypothetical protein JWM78_3134 [Verrucomicrobiaceae bacterium]|nr:hypothetical protein [Verrucomicrobiaceae bacterium]
MTTKKLLPVLVSLFSIASAQASVDLIAIGKVSGTYEDLAVETAPALESGVPGNILGGVGSAITYAGGNTFISVPDRGPNATPYNSAIDDTTSYIPRFQTFNLSLAPSQPGSTLPYVLTPFLTKTTLLSSKTPLYYGNGASANVQNGAPALNDRRTYYFSGRSDNFDPSKNSLFSGNARLDPEGVRVANDGKSVYFTDEYGPYVYQFDRASGQRIGAYKLPTKFAVTKLSSKGDDEINNNTVGRVANKGMEGLAITPDGRYLVGAMQSPLIQDGGTNAPYVRLVKIDIRTGATREYAYELSNIGSASKPKYPTISEIVAINDHEFLLDERDGKGLGDGSSAASKRLYKIDLTNAQDVGAIEGATALASKAVGKTLFLDVVAALNASGIPSDQIPAKLEGITFGQQIEINGVKKQTLYIANDNDFLSSVGGIDNPNNFFVFSFDKADLPGFVAQAIKHDERCDDHDDDRDHNHR